MDRSPRKNLSAKIVALIMASILWVYVMSEQNPTVEINFQSALEVRNLDEMYIAQDVPSTVRVRVRGPRNIITGVSLQDIKSYIDLRGLTQGMHTVRVTTAIPTNLELVEVQPDKIMLALDSVVSRKVPVEVKMTGTPVPGTIFGQIVNGVTQVKVEGFKSRIDGIDKVVARLDMTNRGATFTTEVILEPVNRSGTVQEGVTVSPAKIPVSVNLYNDANKKIIMVQPITSDSLPTGLVLKSVTVEPDKIEVYGEPQFLANIQFLRTEPISLAGVDKNMDKEVKLQTVEGIFLKTESATIRIQVGKK